MADWLELAALLDKSGQVFFARLLEQLDLDIDTDSQDISEDDLFRDSFVQSVLAEIRARKTALGESYPFSFSSDWINFRFTPSGSSADWVYVFSLILSHARKSTLVPVILRPSDTALRAARDLFQVCSTLAAAGKVEGPAFSIGHPRPGKVKFLLKLTEAWEIFGDGKVHAKAPPTAPAKHKDEGIDVIAFWREPDGRHSLGYLVGQAASGHTEWRDKSAGEAADVLMEWFIQPPATNRTTATFIPFYVTADMDENYRLIRRHGYIVHRTRLAALVEKALALAKAGVAPIERVADIGAVQTWVESYLLTTRRRVS